MSIRGARSARHRPGREALVEPVELQIVEGHLYRKMYML